jgi:hypothetical protein
MIERAMRRATTKDLSRLKGLLESRQGVDVAHDEDLPGGRARELLAELTDIDERKMFGGLAFMVNTRMRAASSGPT